MDKRSQFTDSRTATEFASFIKETYILLNAYLHKNISTKYYVVPCNHTNILKHYSSNLLKNIAELKKKKNHNTCYFYFFFFFLGSDLI